MTTSSFAKAFGISVGIHAALIVVAVAGVAGHSIARSRPSRLQPGVVGETRQGTSGTGSVAAPAAGASLDPTQAAKYVGRYESRSRAHGSRAVEVLLINDGDVEHWSLAVVEGQASPQFLNPVAPDTFAFRLAPARRVIFRRATGDSVSALSIRRNRDTSWAERVRQP